MLIKNECTKIKWHWNKSYINNLNILLLKIPFPPSFYSLYLICYINSCYLSPSISLHLFMIPVSLFWQRIVCNVLQHDSVFYIFTNSWKVKCPNLTLSLPDISRCLIEFNYCVHYPKWGSKIVCSYVFYIKLHSYHIFKNRKQIQGEKKIETTSKTNLWLSTPKESCWFKWFWVC